MAASKLSNDKKLYRLLYTAVNNNIYCTGDVDKYSLTFVKDEPTFLHEMLKTSLKKVLDIVLEVSKDKHFPRYCMIFYVLACAINSTSTPITEKHFIQKTLFKVVRRDEDFFSFIKYCAKFKANAKTRLSHSVINITKTFYKKQSSVALATSYAQNHAHFGWNHKDLIKLSHTAFDEPKNAVVAYILFKKPIENEEFKAEREVIDKFHTLRTTREEEIAAGLVKELNEVNLKCFNPELFQSVKVWSEVVSKLPLQDLLEKLPKMFKLGLFKTADFTKLVSDLISNPNTIRTSNIHPVEVFIHTKNFDKGGRPMDPKLIEYLSTEKKVTEVELNKLKARTEPKLPPIRAALQKCLKASYSNIPVTHKRYLITIDATYKPDGPCLTSKNVQCLEAALAYTMSITKTERDVTVAVFNDKEIKVVNFDRGAHFADSLKKLRDHKCEYIVPSASVEWAAKNKKQIDVFINIVNNIEFLWKPPKEVRTPSSKFDEILQSYRKKMNQPNAKLVTLCLSSSRLAMCNGEQTNSFAVNGLDVTVPSVINAFCANKFI